MGVRQTYTENFDLIRTIEDRSKKLVAQELMKSHLYRRFIKTAQVAEMFSPMHNHPLQPCQTGPTVTSQHHLDSTLWIFGRMRIILKLSLTLLTSKQWKALCLRSVL